MMAWQVYKTNFKWILGLSLMGAVCGYILGLRMEESMATGSVFVFSALGCVVLISMLGKQWGDGFVHSFLLYFILNMTVAISLGTLVGGLLEAITFKGIAPDYSRTGGGAVGALVGVSVANGIIILNVIRGLGGDHRD